MGFVATPEEVEAFQATSHCPGFSQEILSADFLTTRDFVQSVLPPGFEPADQPTGNVSVSTWESKLCGEFDCTMVSLDCKWKGKVGKYILTLLVSGDMPVTWGREVWGEIKKTGESRLYRSGNRLFGYGERRGVRLVELDADLTEDLPPNEDTCYGFEIKAYPHSSGIGLHDDARVVTLKIVNQNVKRATGKGTLTLRGTKADPLHTMPVESLGQISYVSGPAEYRAVDETPLGVGDAYLPYLIGRHYDDMREYRVGSSFEGIADQPEIFKTQIISSS